MPVKAKKTTAAKKAKKAKKLAVKRTAKKSVAKKSRAKKTVKKHKQGKRKQAKTSSKKAANKRVTKKPTEKTVWKISPENSQSVVEIDIWKKDDLKIEFLKVYRSGWIIVDQIPDLSGYNPDQGIDIFEEFEFDEHQLHDSSRRNLNFFKRATRRRTRTFSDSFRRELANEGWTLKSVTRFSGPSVVEQV